MSKEQCVAWIINETATVKDIERIKPKISKENGHIVAETVLQEMEEKNRNGRWYGKEDLAPQITCPRTIELLKTGTLRGESGHPDSKDLQRQSKIEKSNCSVLYLNMWVDGNRVMGKYRGTNNELGREVEKDLEEGFLQAFSLRALGSVVNTPNKGAEVKNIRFITYDEVIYPSHPRAYTRGIGVNVNEAVSSEELTKEAIREADITYIKNDKGLIVPITNSTVIDYIKQESTSFNIIKESFDVYYKSISLSENGRTVSLDDLNGNRFVIPLENYVHNSIMDYANKLF